MGISLFGLTPAATYPSLIKFGDNSAISGVLRALSDGLGNDLPIQVSNTAVNFTGTITVGGAGLSPASGVSGAIQFSNGSAFSSDAANLFWDDTNNRLGVGTNTPSKSLHIRTQHGVVNGILLNSPNACGITITGDDYPNELIISKSNNQFEIATNGFFVIRSTVGLTINNPTIKGSGSTAATNSLLVENSSGTQLFKVSDDGASTMQSLNLTVGGGSLMIQGANVLDRGDGTRYGYQSGSQIHRFFTNSGTERLTILNDGSVGIGTNAPTQTLDVNGSAIFSSSVTSLSSFRAHILQANNNASNGRVALQTWDNMIVNVEDGGVGIAKGVYLTPSAQVHIKGSGSTSATTSLLVQNSAGDTALQVFDNTDTRVYGALAFKNGNTYIFNDSNTLVFAAVNSATTDLHMIPSRQVNINNTGSYTAQASALLQIDSTTKGVLFPRMTTTQRDAIVTPATGLKIYNTTTNTTDTYNGTVWQSNSVSGVSGAIQFSNGSAFASDASNFFWDDTNNRLGIGTNAPVTPLEVRIAGSGNIAYFGTSTNSLGIFTDNSTYFAIYTSSNTDFRIGTDGSVGSASNTVTFKSSNKSLGIGVTPTARLHIQGSGSTSATTSLLVQNSAGTESIRVRDDLQVVIGGGVTSTSSASWIVNGAFYNTNTDRNHFGGAVSISTFLRVGANGNPVSSAQLQVDSTTRGFLPPVMTTTQKNAIASPASGLVVYDSTTNKLNYNDGAVWKEVTPDGYTGLVTVNATPPVTFDIQNGIIVNVI